MPENDPPEKGSSAERQFYRQVSRKEARKLKSRSRERQGVWFGLGMFGIVGWSVSLPALAGALLGAWIDRSWPSHYSWTLMLLVGGIILGSLNAWHWVSQEREKIEKEQ
jgi:ATP synthase protein I